MASQGCCEKFSSTALQEATKTSSLWRRSAASTGCQQAEELIAWVGSLLYTHQPGKRQTKASGNPSSLRSSSDCKEPLVRLSNFWWPTWAGAGKHGQARKPRSRSKVELCSLSPKMPDEGRRGTARDVWVISTSKREKVSWREDSVFIPWDQRHVGISLCSSALLKELLLLEHLESPL